MAATIAVPTGGAVVNTLQSYGVGVLAGMGYRMLSGFTGSGIIGGAIAAAIVGATVRGQIGEMLAVNLGFTTGREGLGQLGGLGSLLPGMNGGGGRATQQPQGELYLI